MSSIHRAKKREGFGTAQFAEKDAVGAHAQGGLKQILCVNTGLALVSAGGDEGERVGLGEPHFRRVLDYH
jgi:hypothetical protein